MAGKSLKNTKSLDNLNEAFAGESPGEPPLPLLRPGGRYRGPSRHRSRRTEWR
jgi:hypothetical protein